MWHYIFLGPLWGSWSHILMTVLVLYIELFYMHVHSPHNVAHSSSTSHVHVLAQFCMLATRRNNLTIIYNSLVLRVRVCGLGMRLLTADWWKHPSKKERWNYKWVHGKPTRMTQSYHLRLCSPACSDHIVHITINLKVKLWLHAQTLHISVEAVHQIMTIAWS